MTKISGSFMGVFLNKNSSMKTQNQMLPFQGLCSEAAVSIKSRKIVCTGHSSKCSQKGKSKAEPHFISMLGINTQYSNAQSQPQSLQGNGFLVSYSGTEGRSGPWQLTSRMAPSHTRITLRNVGMTWGRNCTHFSPRDLKIKVMA